MPVRIEHWINKTNKIKKIYIILEILGGGATAPLPSSIGATEQNVCRNRIQRTSLSWRSDQNATNLLPSMEYSLETENSSPEYEVGGSALSASIRTTFIFEKTHPRRTLVYNPAR